MRIAVYVRDNSGVYRRRLFTESHYYCSYVNAIERLNLPADTEGLVGAAEGEQTNAPTNLRPFKIEVEYIETVVVT